jgi:cytosine/adenosine deaminase-related metal-dependent hydrolase
MLINGRGTPPEGPVDIVIEHNIIADVVRADSVTLGEKPHGWKRPEGDRVIDATGMYVTPGLVDMHTHPLHRDGRDGPSPVGDEYAYKLSLAHGVTTLRTCGWGVEETLFKHRRLGEENKMAVPRLIIMHGWPREQNLATPKEARELVREFKEVGADGIKVLEPQSSETLAAICDEAKKVGMKGGVAVDLKLSEIDAVTASKAGVASIEHWYGIPDSALPGTQNFPPEYNYLNESDRFRWAAQLWKEADQYPERMMEVLDLLIKNSTVWDPTIACYEPNRDLGRAMTLPWHDRYTLPSLKEHWSPNPAHHASYFSDWKTSDEIAWKKDYAIWMKYLKMFFDRGGTLTVGTDAGSLMALYGFTTVRELEVLQEAGIHPIDIIKIATTNSTQALGLTNLGGVRKGYSADLVVIDGNPLENFKVMYGTGINTYTPDGKIIRRGGVRWTIKDGIVFDAQALLQDVENDVREMKKQRA